jgi:catechol 2,3-dioxygenase-like lactoylglutathione lyase family enzyme
MMRLHHVNVVSPDVQGLDGFYRTALGLERIPDLPLIPIQGYSDTSSGKVKNPATFLSAGHPDELQLHLCAPDQNLGFRYGHMVNPVAKGHIAFRCDDIEAVKARLESSGIPYSDWGIWAVKDWYQIFLFDPAGTVIEVHQVME